MTLGSQGQGHGGNNLGWVGARHLYLNFDDPRLLVIFMNKEMYGITCVGDTIHIDIDLRVKVTVGMTLDG